MTWSELHWTLAELVSAIEPPAGFGLRVDRAEMDVPLEATVATGSDGLIFLGRVPHSRWESGILSSVHMSRLVIERLPEEEAGHEQ